MEKAIRLARASPDGRPAGLEGSGGYSIYVRIKLDLGTAMWLSGRELKSQINHIYLLQQFVNWYS